MKNKTASLLSICFTVLFFIAGPALLVLFVDPYQVYHKTFFEKSGYSKEQMYQHAGWINRLLVGSAQDYQSIVIGSSVMANYSQALFSEKLPSWGRILNLSMNGSVPHMQAAFAKHALAKSGNIKKILWDVHFFYVFDIEGNKAFPYYLYNENLWDDKGYFFNISNLTSSLKFLSGDFTGFEFGIEDNGPWYEGMMDSGRFDVYKSIDLRKTMLVNLKNTLPLSEQSPEEIAKFKYPEVDKYLIDIVRPLCNGDVEIDVMFSPTTRYSYAAQEDYHHVYSQLYMRRYIVDQTKSCKNIKVFVFDNVDWISGDITNYADDVHYKLKVNTYILESIAQGRHQLTNENIEQYERDFIGAVNEYETLFSKELADMESLAGTVPIAAKP